MYYCRSCGRAEDGTFVPAGWYSIHRAIGAQEQQRRLGLYCTLTCLIKAQRHLQEGAATHADELGLPANDRAVLESLFEQAHRYILEDGFSVRDAGDLLGIPTDVLRSWFASAGISLTTGAVEPTIHPQVSENMAEFLAGQTGRSPLSTVNELKQKRFLAKMTWGESVTGPAHSPVFTCTGKATLADGRVVELRARGRSKSAAKTAAAQRIVDSLSSVDFVS